MLFTLEINIESAQKPDSIHSSLIKNLIEYILLVLKNSAYPIERFLN